MDIDHPLSGQPLQGLSGQLWPVHLKPHPNELLSSWLVRLAHGHGLKLHTFCALVFGRDKNVWNRDIDKFAPEWLINKVAVATGTDVQNVINTTLKSYEGVLYESHQANGNTRWINPLGIYHRTHRHFGLQYCPICISVGEPYFRKYWRLAFYTECERHRIQLLDRCSNCGSAVNFHRAEMGDRSRTVPKSIVHCYQCGHDLSDSPRVIINCNDWQTTVQHRMLLDFHELGCLNSIGVETNYSHQLFDVLRHLCVLMISEGRTRNLLNHAAKQLSFTIDSFNRTQKITFEKRSVYERHVLINCAIWLVLNWPDRFIEVSKINKLSNAYLLKDFARAPYWFYVQINKQLNLNQYSPTLIEIEAARYYLNSIGKPVGITKISRFLGYTTLKNRVISMQTEQSLIKVSHLP